ncbi:MAG: hypothetical protein QNK11_04310 [Legionella sp.]|nr:hypothetical protein [Legionella sp.]
MTVSGNRNISESSFDHRRQRINQGAMVGGILAPTAFLFYEFITHPGALNDTEFEVGAWVSAVFIAAFGAFIGAGAAYQITPPDRPQESTSTRPNPAKNTGAKLVTILENSEENSSEESSKQNMTLPANSRQAFQDKNLFKITSERPCTFNNQYIRLEEGIKPRDRFGSKESVESAESDDSENLEKHLLGS